MNELTDLQRDILIKAAEGIQEGMWCRHFAFANECRSTTTASVVLAGLIKVDEATASRRCATGELALQTALVSAGRADFESVIVAVADFITEDCPVSHNHGRFTFYDQELVELHNDEHIPDNPFAAGQEWARIFREVAKC